MSATPYWPIQAGIPGANWPAVPEPNAAAALAVLQQLEATQWLAPERLLELQLRQLEVLLRHAFASVPYYRARWAGLYDPAAPLTYERFARLPLLSRRELQEHFAELCSEAAPGEHGAPAERRTSGSTGAPVRFLATPLVGLYWNAFTLRDHLWHRRDLALKLAVVRRETERSDVANWGRATHGLVATGRCVGNTIREDARAQLDWLRVEQPAYLFTYPSLVAEMARIAVRDGVRLPGLKEVRTLAEAVGPELRAMVREAWNVPLVDIYTASETGYLALQCPEHEHYHLQSEGALIEVLREDGRPCAPGEVGRVVATPLHNFATLLVRYDIGDYAEAGEPCACGRGLPVVKRILGRVRNMLTTADGRKYWPLFGLRAMMDIAPVLQHQFVQTAFDLVEGRLVVAKPLTPDQEAALHARIGSLFPEGVRLEFVYCDRIERSPSGKFEDFVSEISASTQ